MNRLDRLSSILIHLQSKKVVKAKELAQRFDISIRTVYRDIRSLEAAGIPIGSENGVGYYLAEGYHMPPVMFTSEEAGALLLAGKLAGNFTDSKTKKNFESALYKIKAVLGNEDKEFISGLEEKITIYDAVSEKTAAQDNFIKDIQSALFTENIIEIQYCSPNNRITTRKIEPHSLGFYENYWYLIAFCHLRNAYRFFRIDRIKKLTITDQNFREAPAPLEKVIKQMYESKKLHNVTVRLRKDNNYEIIKNKCILGFTRETDLGDRVEITLLTDSLPVLGKWLLNYGQDVEILSPIELKTIMRQYAKEIAQQYIKTE